MEESVALILAEVRVYYDPAMPTVGGASFLSRNADVIGLVGAVVAVIGIAVAIVIYWRQKSPKTLDYAVEASQDIVLVDTRHAGSHLHVIWTDEALPGSISDIFKGRILRKPRLVKFYIRNTGKIAITAADFQTPITVSLNRGEIIDVSVTGVSHRGIHRLGSIAHPPDQSGPTRQRTFTPSLLNSEDWVKLQITTDQTEHDPSLTCWIKGQSRDMRLARGLLNPPISSVVRSRVKDFDYQMWSPILGIAAGIVAVIGGVIVILVNARGK